jgi:hypothetical protein
MLALEIASLILASISIVGGLVFWIGSWRVSIKREELRSLVDFFGFAEVLESAKESMKEELSDKEREVVARMVWRSSGVPLVSVLRNPEERHYLLQALAKPTRYPWEDESSNSNK